MATNFDNSPPSVDSYAALSDGHALGPTYISTMINNHTDAIQAIETKILGEGIYNPTASGNGLTTFTSTWAGAYLDYGYMGFLSIVGNVTANWAGAGYLSVPLPSGWVASGVDSEFSAYAIPMPAIGVHAELTAILHTTLTSLRFIARLPTPVDVAGTGPGFCVATVTTNLITVGSGAVHGLNIGDKVYVKNIDAAGLPTGLPAGTYYVIASGFTTTACKLSTTSGGSTVTIGSTKNCFVEKITTTDSVSKWSLPVDGVTVPFAFTGDGTVGNQDQIFASGLIFKNPS